MISRTASTRAAGCAFLTAAVTVFTQVLVHRMVSAKLLNNLAFLVISLTMLGFAFSGVALSVWRGWLLQRMWDVVAGAAAAFVLASLGSAAAFYRAELVQHVVRREDFVLQLLKLLPLALTFALPFAFSGLILGMLLTSPGLETRRVYFFDLLGSSLGALLVLPAIQRFGVETAMTAASGAVLVALLALAPPRSPASKLLTAAASIAVASAALFPGTVYALRYPADSMIASWEALGKPYGLEYVRWDPVARIEVSRIPPPDPERIGLPSLIGSNREFHQRFERVLTQNNFAFTFAVAYDGRRESLRGIEETIYAAAYQAASVERPRVLVIGVGGGFDVLSALAFDASEVVGVEINAATHAILKDAYRDYFRGWMEDDRVRLVLAEGRHYLATSDRRFDVIQLSGVDSYSGTSAAAHVFSENYLYTAEAFDLYLSRLAERGLLHMMRLEQQPPREMLRALTTAVAALRRLGVSRPADHTVMLRDRSRLFASLLVKKTPFTPEELRRLAGWAGATPSLELAAAPRANEAARNAYQDFLVLDDPRLERAGVARYFFDIAPVEDDRPFFFRQSFWWHLWSDHPWAPASTTAMELSLLVLLAVVGLACALCVYLPLRLLAAEGRAAPGSLRHGVFFGAIAVGYMTVELALLQKFGLLLGHPNYALSVVLATLLLGTGLGSLASARIVAGLGQARYLGYVLALLILMVHVLVLPRLAAWLSLPFFVRAGLAVAVVLPVGIILGTFFPTGLESLKRAAPAYAPWAWGLNGIFSVLAPLLAIGFSMSFGISALLLSAVPVYLVAALALPEPQAALLVASPASE